MNTAPRLLVFQHLDVEHPGIFRDFLAADGINWDVVELDRGETIPELADYDGLWVMGGPMDVWEESSFPWLVPEKAAIRRAVLELELPFLGICLGHQLLAAALGGEVAKGVAEVGVMAVAATPAGRDSPYLSGLPAKLDCLQWHGAEVTVAPPGSLVLARSPACAIQALSIGTKAFSAQFHVEVTAETVPDWNAVPAYAAALEEALGVGAVTRFQEAVDAGMAEFNAQARRLYDNWMAATGVCEPRILIEGNS